MKSDPTRACPKRSPPTLAVVVRKGVEDGARALIWNTFFDSKGRGLSLPLHFPWIDDDDIWSVVTIDEGCVVAALVVKPHRILSSRLGLVGLVCVASSMRGMGISQRMIQSAIKEAAGARLDALMLWTRTPGVYEGQGFEVDAVEILASVRRFASLKQGTAANREPWPIAGRSCGLPPFATSAERLWWAGAEAIILHTPRGISVAEWRGPESAVATLLAMNLPEAWHIHLEKGDAIVKSLKCIGFHVTTQAGSCRMVKYIGAKSDHSWPAIRLLERV